MTPRSKTTYSLLLCGLFAALVAVGAFIRIPLPIFSITLQTLFVSLTGLMLGSKKGSISILVYIAIGLVGIPVFSRGGGIGYVFQPSFGFLIGFIAAAFVTGKIAHKVENPSYKRLLVATLAGIGVMYVLGLPYFYLLSNYYLSSPMSVWTLFAYCFFPTIPGDIAFSFLAAFIAKRMLPILKKNNLQP